MNCERVVELLTGPVADGSAEERRIASEHVAGCEDCRNAVAAVHALRLASLAPVPAPRPGTFERVMAHSTQQPARHRSARAPFWLGMGAGAALAASVAAAIVMLAPQVVTDAALTATPQLSLAVNETRDVNISLTTESALVDAEILVTLSGAVGVNGYEGQRRLQWRTDLDAGTNRLTLPIVASGIEGGQVLVEVVHEDRRRTFLVDVLARAG
jgi:anti-sigma factor RsiW